MQIENIPSITLSGRARERGRQHGAACADDIRKLRGAWALHAAPAGVDARAYMRQFRSDTDYLAGFRKYAPHLLEEIIGMAEGADLPFEDLFELQLLDEEWSYRARRNMSAGAPHHCSAIALKSADGATIIAQNFDGVSWMEGFQRLFLHEDSENGRRMLIFSLPGMLALNGVNDRSLALCVNSLVQLDGEARGLPVMGVIRLMLEAETFSAARTRLASIPHGSGQNYVIGARDGYGSFEASGGRVCAAPSCSIDEAIAHTNHPLINDDNAQYRSLFEMLPLLDQHKKLANSSSRQAQLEAALADPQMRTIDGVRALFSSRENAKHPLSREMPGTLSAESVIDYTLACTIYEISAKPALHFSPGPPSATEFRTYRLAEAFSFAEERA